MDIHFTNKEMTEMMVYLPEHRKTYFVSADEYERQLQAMKSPWVTDMVKEIRLFLEK
jgi:hypothetical protein